MVLLLDRSVSFVPNNDAISRTYVDGWHLASHLATLSLYLSSPPMIMSVSLLQLDNTLMALSKALFFIGIFILSLLLVKIHRISGRISLVAWAYVFPLAAATIATTKIYGYSQAIVSSVLLVLTIPASSIVVSYMIRAIKGRTLCAPED